MAQGSETVLPAAGYVFLMQSVFRCGFCSTRAIRFFLKLAHGSNILLFVEFLISEKLMIYAETENRVTLSSARARVSMTAGSFSGATNSIWIYLFIKV